MLCYCRWPDMCDGVAQGGSWWTSVHCHQVSILLWPGAHCGWLPVCSVAWDWADPASDCQVKWRCWPHRGLLVTVKSLICVHLLWRWNYSVLELAGRWKLSHSETKYIWWVSNCRNGLWIFQFMLNEFQGALWSINSKVSTVHAFIKCTFNC